MAPAERPAPPAAVLPEPLWQQLRRALPAWREIGASSEVIDWIVRGVRLPFEKPLASFDHGQTVLEGAEKAFWEEQLLPGYLANGAFLPIPPPPRGRRFVSRVFLIPKPDGGFRLIWDGRWLNRHCTGYSFRFEGLTVLAEQAQPLDFFVKWDIKDAFHHLAVAEEHREYLTFCVNGQYYQMTVLPFGYLNAPFHFAKLMRPVVQELRNAGAHAAPRGEVLSTAPDADRLFV